ncbi:MAG: BNR-4 repeat-containing protein [Opitutaceae bacterium]|tara:strand:+ start:19550 stop:20878 length:1329 start_codon:yes stop_codon:yes gene_type:complete
MKFIPLRFLAFFTVIAACSLTLFSGAERTIISEEGSGRATAYIESPKIISFEGKTHVAWLDSPTEGFRIRIRTLDRSTGEWSGATTIGEATDNHGGPALTIDEAGYLHVVYYSHHHPFRYSRSVRPNDASEWTEYQEFGIDLTYPSLVCAPDGTLILTARRSFKEKPWDLEMWTKAPDQPWARKHAILSARYGVYSQYGSSLAWSADHKTLHLGFRIYELPNFDTNMPECTVGYLASHDNGNTWHGSDGQPVAIPATAATVDIIAHGLNTQGRILHSGSMAVGPDDQPHIPYSVRTQKSAQGFLATPIGDGRWNHHHLNQYLPPAYRNWGLYLNGAVSFGTAGQPTVLGTVLQVSRDDHAWGQVSTELVRFRSNDGGKTFIADILDEANPESPRWMPSIERPTGFNEMPAYPSFIYTDGVVGSSLHDQLSNKVIYVPGTPAP